MRQVQVYIEGKKIELFDDEQINVTSSVQNINDISKVFTDFSQSFTVPASTVNNAIFQHFYQSDVGDTQTGASLIDHNIRRNAVIEIDLTTLQNDPGTLRTSLGAMQVAAQSEYGALYVDANGEFVFFKYILYF